MLMTGIRKLITDRAANVGILLALAAVPVVACAGAAMDYIQANQQRTELQARLDTAVLAAVSVSANGKAEGKRRAAAEKLFKENCSSNDCKAKLNLTFNGTKVRGTAEFDMPTAFMRVVGINTMPIAATAEAASGSQTYYDVYLAFDISVSMGVGATVEDQHKMQAALNCVFACHINGTTRVNGPGADTLLEQTRLLGVPIRLDATKAAAIAAVDSVEDRGGSAYIRFGIYPFHNVSRQALAPSADYKKIRETIDGLQLADNLPKTFLEDDAGDTYATRLFDLLEGKLKSKGKGTKGNPYKLVIYLSDGTMTNREPNEKFKVQPLDPKLCDRLRKRGAQVAVVHTEYVYAGPPDDWGYYWFLRPVEDQIAPSMKACADDGMYYSAARPEEIARAFEDIVTSLAGEAPRLTQ